VTYPFDVVRRRLQVDNMPGNPYQYTGVRGAFATIFKNEGTLQVLRVGCLPCTFGSLGRIQCRCWRGRPGIRGFYKGMIPNYLKVAPAMSVSFVTYEWAKALLKG